MNMITGIDRPTAGAVTVDGRLPNEMDEERLAIWRGQNVGIVFQFFSCCRSRGRRSAMREGDLVIIDRRSTARRGLSIYFADLIGR